MDSSIEKNFIEKFINKQYKERLSFELASKKKRIEGIERFSHGIELLLDKKYLGEKSEKLDKRTLEKYALHAPVYLLSYQHSDGVFMECDQAIEYLSETPSAAIAVFGDVCIIKAEYEGGQATYYILKN